MTTQRLTWIRRTVRLGIGAAAGLALLVACGAVTPAVAAGDAQTVRVVKDDAGQRLQVDGRDLMVLGMNWDYMPIGENYLYALWNQPDDVIIDALAREMPLLQDMGVNVIRQYVGVPARWIRYIYENYGIYHRAQPLRRALRLLPGRRLDPVGRLLRPAPARGRHGGGRRPGRGVPRHARPLDVAAGQREQLRPDVVVGRDRGAARGRARRRPRPSPLLALRPDHRRDQAPGRESPRGHRQRRHPVHRSHRPGMPRARHPRHQRLPRHLGPRPLRRGQGEAGHARDVHRVRRRRLQRAHQERGPGHPGALLRGPVARDLRAVRRQGPRGQRHRRLHLPVERWLVEVRPGRPARHPRHQRLVAQCRLRGGLRRGREQHERGVVGHHRQGRVRPPRPLHGLSARRLLRAEAGLHARSLREGHRSGRHPRALQRRPADGGRGGRARRRRRPRRRIEPARARGRRAHGVRDLQHRRRTHHDPRDAAGRRHHAAGVPGLRPPPVLLRGRRGQPHRGRHRPRVRQHPGQRADQSHRRDLLREPRPRAHGAWWTTRTSRSSRSSA